MSSQIQPKEEWIKILNKGIITIPKKLREQAGIKEGDVAKIKLQGKKIIIESSEEVRYRNFTKKQIDQWIKDDELPSELAGKIDELWPELP